MQQLRATFAKSTPYITIDYSKSKGDGVRGLFVTRNIPPRQKFLTAFPLVAHQSQSSTSNLCSFCFRPKRICPSNECVDQVIHSQNNRSRSRSRSHNRKQNSSNRNRNSKIFSSKSFIQTLSQTSNLPPPPKYSNFHHLVLKLAVRTMFEPPDSSGPALLTLQNLVFASNFREDIGEPPDEFHQLTSHLESLNLPSSYLTFDLYKKLMAILHLNVFSFPNGGSALYSLPSFMNHDCSPNCSMSFQGAVMDIVSGENGIAAGEEISTCYDFSSSSACQLTRRKNLELNYGFSCRCNLCNNIIDLATQN